MILPGNGCEDILGSNWYADLKEKIEQLFKNWEGGYIALNKVICLDMPDPYVARESVWIPFVEKHLEPHRNLDQEHSALVLIGHSSGAECAMRYIEKHKIHACLLVSACWSDMGDLNERKSGYYNRPWDWEMMRKNCPDIIQFGSEDDYLVDFESEQRVVFDSLKSKAYIFQDKGHFLTELVDPAIVNSIAKDILGMEK